MAEAATNQSEEKRENGCCQMARKRDGPFASPTKLYRGVQLIQRNYELMPELEKFEAYSDDIIIATFPKSGTTWMQAIVTLILNNCDPSCLHNGLLEEKWPYLESGKKNPNGRHLDGALKMARPRTLKTHLAWQALPESAHRVNSRIIYVARNPKDTIVSMYYFVKSHRVLDYRGNFEDFVRLFLEDGVVYCPYFGNLASYWSRQGQDNILFTTYEKLHKDPVNEVLKVADFLNKPVDKEAAARIVHYTTFDEMKNNDCVNYSQTHKMGIIDFGVSPFFRSGKIGTWKQHFTVAQNEVIDDWINHNLSSQDLQGLSFEYA